MSQTPTTRPSWRQFASGLALATLAASPAWAQADDYPNRPIKLVVAGGAGSITDQTARLVADLVSTSLKATIVVENRPGANGILANSEVMRAKPDGYTLLFTYSATMTVNPWMMDKLPYDPITDFTPIGRASQPGGNLLAVNADFPAKNMAELFQRIKEAKEPLAYCSWGIGSGGHLVMEFLLKQKNLKMRHVPYKSAGACTNDLAAGHVPIGFVDTISPLPVLASGKVRGLAVSAPERLLPVPKVPTLIEEGVDFPLAAWLAFFGPKDMPVAIVDKLNRAINDSTKSEEARKRFAALYLRPAQPSSPAELAALLKNDLQAWGNVVKAIGPIEK